MTRSPTILALAFLGLVGCEDSAANPMTPEPSEAGIAPAAAARAQTIPVSGSGVHYFTTAVVHSQQPTETGMIQRSSDIIRLTGDIDGYVLYHPTSVFDFAAGTLTNTGTQLFSGTVAGSSPVILHDDTFRFESDLSTGATTGEVHLRRGQDAPHSGGWFECDLSVVGTGLTPEGDAMVDYSGECIPRGNLSAEVSAAGGP
jgi:hypothetical protein